MSESAQRVAVFGAGYVGLVTGACFAELGHTVVVRDIIPKRIEALRRGEVPIYEPGLEPMIARNVAAGRLKFTTDIDDAVAHGALLFIAVGTPPDEDGSADMQYVLAAARNIGRRINDYRIVVDTRNATEGKTRGQKAPVKGANLAIA